MLVTRHLSHPQAKSHLIFSAISILQHKILKVGKIWLIWGCYVTLIYLTNCFYLVYFVCFLFFVVNLSVIAPFYSVKVLFDLIS